MTAGTPGAGAAAAPSGPGSLWSSVRAGAARFWMEALMWLASRAPVVLRASRPVILFIAWRCSPSMRDATMANAARILGPEAGRRQREALAKRVVGSFYDFVVDIGRHRSRPPEELRRLAESVEGEHHYRRARALGRGAIIVTAHLGSFELGAALLRAHEERIHVVFRRDRLSSFDHMRAQQHASLGVVEAALDERVGGLGVWLRLRDALLANEVVMVQGDRVMRGQRGVRVPFLSGHIEMPAGPVKLAMATGAPIVPVFTIRTGGDGFRVVIEEPMTVEPGPVRWEEPHPTLLRLAAVIERQVARYPDQWLMLHRVWCEDQLGAGAGPA